MPATYATAPAKVILFGEHAVVYGQPALAVPVNKVRAKATIFPDPQGASGKIILDAPDIQLHCEANQLSTGHPFSVLLRAAAEALNIPHFPALTLRITSTIPVAGGMGSGAAVSVAVTRALCAFVGRSLTNQEISEIAYQVEKVYHGNPSGVDNTVIAYNQPVYFQKNIPHEFIKVRNPFTIVIADSGIKSSTSVMVEKVRKNAQSNPLEFEQYFNDIGQIASQARSILESQDSYLLGPLMNDNHRLLQQIGVSCPELDQLVYTAQQSGALGAKLCGAGGGGNIIGLATELTAEKIASALKDAGAQHTIITKIDS